MSSVQVNMNRKNKNKNLKPIVVIEKIVEFYKFN